MTKLCDFKRDTPRMGVDRYENVGGDKNRFPFYWC